MTTLYGIHNCDTVKKARKWLTEAGIEHQFHDFRKQGLTQEQVKSWLQQVDWQTLLNKRGLTWRQLDQQTKDSVNADNIVELLVAHPTLIKRPVVVTDERISVGFKADDFANRFKVSNV